MSTIDERTRVTVPASETLSGYDRWAPHYDQDDNPLVAATAWVLTQAPLDVRGARVVELGCGTGRHVTGLLAAGAAAFVGIDGAAAMLAVARRRTDDPRVRWIQAPLDALAEATAGFDARPDAAAGFDARPDAAGFDVGLIVLVLEHATALAPIFAGAARWLRAGATLRILELHPERIAAGTVAHFVDGEVEHRFASVAHPVDAVFAALDAAGFAARARAWIADDALLAVAPRLRKHAGRAVVLDVEATRR